MFVPYSLRNGKILTKISVLLQIWNLRQIRCKENSLQKDRLSKYSTQSIWSILTVQTNKRDDEIRKFYFMYVLYRLFRKLIFIDPTQAIAILILTVAIYLDSAEA